VGGGNGKGGDGAHDWRAPITNIGARNRALALTYYKHPMRRPFAARSESERFCVANSPGVSIAPNKRRNAYNL